MTEMLSKELIKINRTFFRFFLSLLVFELRGVVFLTPPPPPTMAKVAETSTRARVNTTPWRFETSVLALHSKIISKI